MQVTTVEYEESGNSTQIPMAAILSSPPMYHLRFLFLEGYSVVFPPSSAVAHFLSGRKSNCAILVGLPC